MTKASGQESPSHSSECSSHRKISAPLAVLFSPTTARVMMVPDDVLFFDVFGTTLAARNCCLPFSPESPNKSTCVNPSLAKIALRTESLRNRQRCGLCGFAAAAAAVSVFVAVGPTHNPPEDRHDATELKRGFRVAPVLTRDSAASFLEATPQGKDGLDVSLVSSGCGNSHPAWIRRSFGCRNASQTRCSQRNFHYPSRAFRPYPECKVRSSLAARPVPPNRKRNRTILTVARLWWKDRANPVVHRVRTRDRRSRR